MDSLICLSQHRAHNVNSMQNVRVSRILLAFDEFMHFRRSVHEFHMAKKKQTQKVTNEKTMAKEGQTKYAQRYDHKCKTGRT